MILLLALVGAGLLLFGLVDVWNGRWRAMGAGMVYAVALAAICFTAESWFPLVGMSRGDGFILIGYMMVGASLIVGAAGALLIAIPIHFLRRRRAAQQAA